jgi:DNA-binding transcriptional MerR regulator
MDAVPIGDAARMLEINPSALRYYEERGLVRPARRAGRRVYGPEQLRRLAFIQILQRLGVGLDAASAVLDQPSEQWRGVVREQIAGLEDLIARASAAQSFLRHALDCPADHPVQECPFLIETLDRRLAGATFEQLAAEHAAPNILSG